MACAAAGRAEEWERVGGRLVADPGKLLRAGWQPAIDTHAGLAALAGLASPRAASTASSSRPSS
jgi:UDP-glucose 4-epimerase